MSRKPAIGLEPAETVAMSACDPFHDLGKLCFAAAVGGAGQGASRL